MKAGREGGRCLFFPTPLPISHSVTRQKEEVVKLIYVRVKLTKTINSHQGNLCLQKTVSS